MSDRAPTTALLLHDFNDASCVDTDSLGVAKVEDHVAITGCAEFIAIRERILSPVVEPDYKRAERAALDQIFDVSDLRV